VTDQVRVVSVRHDSRLSESLKPSHCGGKIRLTEAENCLTEWEISLSEPEFLSQ